MTPKGSQLLPHAWTRIWRVSLGLVAASTTVSVILSHIFMGIFSAGLNLQGVLVAVLMPLTLGGPMMFYLTLKHEQLRHANSRLERLAATDWLTTCLNRGAFTAQVMRDLGRRTSGTLENGGALLIVDADDFKQVNDRFGHQQGDIALMLIAEAIRLSVGGVDLVGRIGGEEFGVYLPDADLAAADRTAERIRLAVSQLLFTPNAEVYPLSVSIGGASFPHHAEFNELYRLADQRLYAAKHAGRDRVAVMQAA